MNLYIFNETSRGSAYGIGTYIRELGAALKNSDIHVCTVNLLSEKLWIQTTEIDGIEQWDFPAPAQKMTLSNEKQWDLYHRNIVYLLQLHIKNKKDLIFHLNYNQKGPFAEELKKAFDCKIVLTIHYLDWCLKLSGNLTRFRQLLETQHTDQHDIDLKGLKESFQKEKETFQTVDHLICLSENTRYILNGVYNIKPEKITVLYNGLSDTTSIVEKSELRKKYLIPDIPIILFAGRLDRIKGLLYALQGFRIVLNTYPNCRFIIAGNGAFDLHMDECEDLWMNVTWTGLINKEKLYELYTLADIGIMPSFHEQCSYVAIEMMMHGLPIIGSTSTGLCEMIKNHVTGLHIPVVEHADRTEIDSSLLAEKILYLLQHPIQTKQMGENGRKRYLDNYSLDIFRNNMRKVYQSILEQ